MEMINRAIDGQVRGKAQNFANFVAALALNNGHVGNSVKFPRCCPLSPLLLPDFPSKEICALMGAQREETVPALPCPPGPFLCLQTFQAMAIAKICGRSGSLISQSPSSLARTAA
jgi:hypothetical protein